MAQLDPQQLQQYNFLYKQADIDKDGVIGPNDALHFFQRSGLTKEALGAIWNTVTNASSTPLSLQQFVVACQLISLAQKGIPPTLQELSQHQHQQIPVPQFVGVTTQVHAQVPVHVISSSSGEQPVRREFSWSASPALLQDYAQKFAALDTDRDGFIPGKEAAQYLANSELPGNTLAKLWELSDINKDGKLDVQEFCLAMFLVTAIKAGNQVPTPLPQSLLSSIWQGGNQSVSAPPTMQQPIQQSNAWVITQQEVSTWSQLFDTTDTERQGVVNGLKARELFVKSQLPNPDLATIYSLSDIDKDGNLNRTEFVIAMKLIKLRCTGVHLPSELPAELRQSVGLPAVSATPASASVPVSSGAYTSSSGITPTLSSALLRSASSSTSSSQPKQEEAKIDDLQSQLRTLDNTNKELTTRLAKITSERNQFEQSYKKVSKEKRDTEADLRDNQYKLSRALDRSNELDGKLIQAEARLAVLGSRGADPTTAFTQQLEAKDRELAELREKLRTSEQLYRNKIAETESKLQDALERLSLAETQSYAPPVVSSHSIPASNIPPPPREPPPMLSSVPKPLPQVQTEVSSGLPPPLASSFLSVASPVETTESNPFLLGVDIPARQPGDSSVFNSFIM